MNKLSKTVKAKDIYFEFLSALNGILKLSKKKLQVLAKIVELDSEIVKPGFSRNVISTSRRKIIMRDCNITSDNLSRFITEYKSLGYIMNGNAEDEWIVNKALIPELIRDRVQITIILKTDSNENI